MKVVCLYLPVHNLAISGALRKQQFKLRDSPTVLQKCILIPWRVWIFICTICAVTAKSSSVQKLFLISLTRMFFYSCPRQPQASHLIALSQFPQLQNGGKEPLFPRTFVRLVSLMFVVMSSREMPLNEKLNILIPKIFKALIFSSPTTQEDASTQITDKRKN